MPSLHRFICLLIIIVFITSCKKEDRPGESVENVSALIALLADPASSSNSLNIMESNGSVRWKKTGWGIINGLTYDKDILFVSGQGPYVPSNTVPKFHAYNVNTGVETWSRSVPGELMWGGAIRNDTLYCAMAVQVSGSVNNGYIAAFDTKTGTLYWNKLVSNPYWPTGVYLDGNTLYFIYTNSVGVSILNAFEIGTQTIKWTYSLGFAITQAYSFASYTPDRLIISQGSSKLIALNKQNGIPFWTKTNGTFEKPALYNSTVYTTEQDGSILHSIDIMSGNTKWSTPWVAMSSGSTPCPSSSGVVLTGNDQGGPCLKSYDHATGSVLWRRATSHQFEYARSPFLVGDKIYTTNKRYDGMVHLTRSALFSYNSSNGQPVDSVIFSSESKRVLILGSSGKLYFGQ